jgi:methylmalonyl-CoA/ethylmalonyl-CoA epimerase
MTLDAMTLNAAAHDAAVRDATSRDSRPRDPASRVAAAGQRWAARAVADADRAWQVTRLHHVAFAHAADNAPGGLAGLLGLTCSHTEPGAGFTERMLPAGEGYLQLLEATGPGVIERFVDQRGPGLHHVAFEVSSLDAAVADLRGRGVRLAGEAPRPGGGGRRIAFIHPAAAHGLLIELVEPPAAAT